ncbi:MAG: THUMP domain-containing protein [Parachlamydiales bacterium]|jgi:putative N6-adenine-specific DNA methylase
MTKEEDTIFVTCGPGLEELLAAELQRLGCLFLKEGFRGVYVDEASLEDCCRINYCSRIATRVLWPLVRFKCNNRDALYKAALDIPWEKIVNKRATIAIDSNVTNNNQFNNSHFAGLVVKDALCDRLRDLRGERPSVNIEEPDVQINLHVSGYHGTIYLDTSGIPLHKRGYRLDGGMAPLQENLAAAILQLIGYDGSGVLCDPLCGSGTFLAEAALMATGTAPGFLRTKWGFMNHPHFKQEEWLKLKNTIDRLRRPLAKNSILGVDCNSSVIQICKKNLRAAGFHNDIQVEHTDFTETSFKGPIKWIVANPPYDRRLSSGPQAGQLYSLLSQFIALRKPENYGVLIPSESKEKWSGSQSIKLSNGGFPIQLLTRK